MACQQLFPFPSMVVQRHGALRVSGNRIVGSHGTPVQIFGYSLFWSNWMGKYYTPECVRWLVEVCGSSLIRIAMGADPRFDKTYVTGGEAEELRKVAIVVEACIDAGIYCIIDWHVEGDASTHLQQASSFFSQIAEKYGNLPNVLFEIWNEPTDQEWTSVIKPYHQRVLTRIRRHSQNLCILGTSKWSQDVDIAARDPLHDLNVAYSLHFYAATHKHPLREKAKQALEVGVALFCTEWGACDASGNGANDFGESLRWLQFLEHHCISHAAWSISDKEESAAALRPGTTPATPGKWPPRVEDLTESGNWVLHKLAMIAHGERLGEERSVSNESLAKKRKKGETPIVPLLSMTGAGLVGVNGTYRYDSALPGGPWAAPGQGGWRHTTGNACVMQETGEHAKFLLVQDGRVRYVRYEIDSPLGEWTACGKWSEWYEPGPMPAPIAGIGREAAILPMLSLTGAGLVGVNGTYRYDSALPGGPWAAPGQGGWRHTTGDASVMQETGEHAKLLLVHDGRVRYVRYEIDSPLGEWATCGRWSEWYEPGPLPAPVARIGNM